MHVLRSTLVAVLSLFLFSAAALADETKLTIRTAAGVEHAFTVELADTPEQQSRGLMFRESLAPDAGMLFDFHVSRPTNFWMQNTLIPLDMLFIREDGSIARIQVNAKPLDTTSIPSGEPVRYVLEVPGGRTLELGIAAGDTVQHDRIPKAK